MGITRAMDRSHLTVTRYAGSPRYMAPEVYDGEGHRINEKVDIWALGCIILELFEGGLPHYECNSMHELMVKVCVKRKAPVHPKPERMSTVVRTQIFPRCFGPKARHR